MGRRLPNNEIILYKDFAEIVLCDKSGEENGRAKIDLDCVSKVENIRWYLRPDGYVATSNYLGTGYAYLHSVILGDVRRGNYGDHGDGNRLDNTKNNLREATPTENGMNKKIRSNNTSGRTGVHWSKSNNKWCAMICANGKHMNLGYFDQIESAVECRRKAEEKYFGSFKPSERRASREI